jgi:hypothetical protein
MTKLALASLISIALFAGCGNKKDGGGGDDPSRKATADECQKAYDHVADIEAADGKMSKDELVKLAQGYIEHCPKMTTKAGIDCLMALQKHDIMAEADCSRKK